MSILYVLIVGGLAGWLAGLVVKGRGSGILINIVLGIIGAFVGNYLFQVLNTSNSPILGINPNSFTMDLITGVVGAMTILLVARVLSR